MDVRPYKPYSLFWRAWWRSLSVKRPQALVAVAALGVGATVAAMLLNLYSSVHRKMSEEFRAYGANVIVSRAPDPALRDGSGLFEQSAVDRVSRLSGASKHFGAVPELSVVARLRRIPADPRLPEFENAIAVGADFHALEALNPAWRLDARGGVEPRLDGVGEPEAILGVRAAKLLKLETGGMVSLQPGYGVSPAAPAVFRIAGVVSTGGSEDDQVFIPLDRLQTLSGLPGKISLIELSIPGETPEIEGVVRELKLALPGLDFRPVRQIVYSAGAVLDTIRWLLISLSALILVIIALAVSATITAIVLERRKDIAVMKALGAGNRLVMRLFLAEGAAIGLVGGVAGFLLGSELARQASRRIFDAALRLDWRTLPVVVGASVLVAAATALVPARLVSGVQPASVLKGE